MRGTSTNRDDNANTAGTPTVMSGRLSRRKPFIFNADFLAGAVSRAGSPKSTRPVWWGRQDSNLQPECYEHSALTIELRPH